VIATRRLQQHFADGLIAEAVEDLWEPWMHYADTALEDDALLLIIQEELAKRCKKSKTRGRKATSAEVVLRMLLLKHVRDWSYETLSREVRANLVYRDFTRIGGGKVPDDRTMGNLARQLGPEVIEKLHRRVVEIAQEKQIATGRKLRVDTTVVETDVHYPTDSTLLGDGVRVLTRRRLDMWSTYHQWFESIEKSGKVRRPIVPRECGHNAHMYYLLLPDLAARTEFIARLDERGVQGVFHYVPLHSSPLGQQVGRTHGDMSNTSSLSERLVRLPLWLGLESEQVQVIQRVIEAVS